MVETAVANPPGLPEAWQLEGNLLLAESRPDSAMAAYRKALEVKPDYLLAHSALVSLLIQQGELEDARKHVELVNSNGCKISSWGIGRPM